MGIDRNGTLMVGFIFSLDELKKKFEQELPEIRETIPVFNRYTGEREGTEDVIRRRAGRRIRFLDRDLDDDALVTTELTEELQEHLTGRLGFPIEMYWHGDWYTDDLYLSISPQIMWTKGDVFNCAFDPMQFCDPVVQVQIRELERELNGIGLEAGDFTVAAIMDVT